MCHTINIGGIEFLDPDGNLDLQYPKYESLIDYGIVDNDVRRSLQLEPAFQFLDPARMEGSILFRLSLATTGVVFARKVRADGQPGEPAWSEAGGLENLSPLVTSVAYDMSDRICYVEVQPASWPDDFPSVVALRLFCQQKMATTFDDYGGVSLTLIRPKDEPIVGHANRCPADEAPFTIKVTDITEGEFPVPLFNIFKEQRLPDVVSVEPALRVSDRRPSVNLKIELPDRYCFSSDDHAYGDDVTLFQRGGNPAGRPPELSRAVSYCPSRGNFQFSWRRNGHETVSPVSVYSPVELKGSGAKVRQLRIDPTVITDPPPNRTLTKSVPQ